MAFKLFGNETDGNTGEVGSDDSTTSNDSGGTPYFLGGDGNASGSDSRDATGAEFDGSIHISPDKRNADGSFRKKRGRKAGGTNHRSTGQKADISASVDSLARVLGYLHLGVSAAFKTPELALKEDECKALSGATVRVLEEFDIRPDPKVEAVVALITTAGVIYGPRYYFIQERKRKERADTKEQVLDNGAWTNG